MPDLHVVSWSKHSSKRWTKPASYAFASGDPLVMIGLHEIPRLITQLPIAFTRYQEASLPVALLGFAPGQNLVVSKQGQWLADYVPTFYRTYPFRMAQNEEGKFVLCVDHASNLVHDHIAGFRFFDDDKKPSADTTAVVNMLLQLEGDRAQQAKICALLDEQGLIEPWPLTIQATAGAQPVDNLFRVNETKLNGLPADVLFALRNLGGLALVYGQLFSMQHVQALGNIAQRQHWTAKTEQGRPAPTLNIGDEDGILSFTNL